MMFFLKKYALKNRGFAKGLLLSACLLCASGLSAQNRAKIDQTRSLWYAPEGSITDSTRFIAGHILSATYSSWRLDSLLCMAKEMIAYGQKAGKPNWMALGWIKTGKYYYIEGVPDSAILAYREGLRIAHSSKADSDERLFLLTLGHLGLGRTLGDFDQLDSAIYHLNSALSYSGKKNLDEYKSIVFQDLGRLYFRKGQYSKALQYLYQCPLPNSQFETATLIIRIFKAIGLEEKAKANFADIMQREKESTSLFGRFRFYACAVALQSSLKEKEYWLHKGLHLADSLHLDYAVLNLSAEIAGAYLDSLQLEKAAQYIHRCQHFLNIKKQAGYRDVEVSVLQARLDHLRGNIRASYRLCREILPYYEHNNDLIVLANLYDLQRKNLALLGDAKGALVYIDKKEAIERLIDSKREINTVLSDYFQQLSASEKAALQAAKDNAEKLAIESKTKEHMSYGLMGAMALLFGTASTFFYLFYRQKRRVTEALARLNRSLAKEQEKLRQSNHKLRQFSGIVSHDILSNLDLILSAGNVLASPEAPKSMFGFWSGRKKGNQCVYL